MMGGTAVLFFMFPRAVVCFGHPFLEDIHHSQTGWLFDFSTTSFWESIDDYYYVLERFDSPSSTEVFVTLFKRCFP